MILFYGKSAVVNGRDIRKLRNIYIVLSHYNPYTAQLCFIPAHISS